MGQYADNHGGNSFFSNVLTVATHPFNPGEALNNKYTTQITAQNLQANTLLAQQQQEAAKNEAAKNAADAAGASASADTQQIIKWIAIVVLLLIIAFAIWYYLKHRG